MINSKNGYYTNAGNAGSKFSGGERQRLTIARALLKDSPIAVLDEATGYSDSENEAIIQQSIDNLVKIRPLLGLHTGFPRLSMPIKSFFCPVCCYSKYRHYS